MIATLAAIFTGRSGSIEPHRIAGALGVLGGAAVLVLLQGETGSVFVYCAITLSACARNSGVKSIKSSSVTACLA